MNNKVGVITAILISIASFLFVLLTGAKASVEPVKMAVVDYTKVFDAYQGAKEASDLYTQRSYDLALRIDSMKQDLQTRAADQATYEKLPKEEQQRYLLDRNKLMELQAQVEDKMIEEDQKLTAGVVSKITTAVREYAEAKGYNLVLTSAEGQSVVYAEAKQLDITEEIIKKLNAEYAGE